MEVILLEKVNKLGAMGETVSVRPGYARNFLLPQKKALRATDANKAYFEAQRATLEKANADKRSAAEKEAKKIENAVIAVIRQASEAGQLYGSVTSRDIADFIQAETGVSVERRMIDLNQNFKTLGLFDVPVILHPEVIVTVTLNIARSQEEAAIQKKTGKALIESEKEEEEKKPESQEKAEAAAEAAQAEADAEVAESEEGEAAA